MWVSSPGPWTTFRDTCEFDPFIANNPDYGRKTAKRLPPEEEDDEGLVLDTCVGDHCH